MNYRSENWSIDNIIVNLKKKIKFFSFFSLLYKYINFFVYFFSQKNNNILKNKHKGQVCYIIGNGTSINEVDLQNINDGVVFACNQIFFHKNFDEINIKYYTLIEPFFGSFFGAKYVKEFINLFEDINRAFAGKSTSLFFHPTIKKMLKKYNLLQQNNLYYVTSLSSNAKPEMLSNNMSGVFNFGQGALSFMIGSAIYMGFKKIILIGCGYTYNPRQQYHFYDRPIYSKSQFDYDSFYKQAQKDFLEKGLFITDIEESEDYFMPVVASEFVDDNIKELYIMLLNFANFNNVEIINIHPKGYSSPIFKGCTWDHYNKYSKT
jgi:hypothetical protein